MCAMTNQVYSYSFFLHTLQILVNTITNLISHSMRE